VVVGVPWWQWTLANVLTPIAIGLVAAIGGYYFALRRLRVEGLLAGRRAAYGTLLPALADLLAADALEYHHAFREMCGQAIEDEGQPMEPWIPLREAALAIVQQVRAQGALAASPEVLQALSQLAQERDRGFENSNYLEALDANISVSRRALEAIQKAAASEFS